MMMPKLTAGLMAAAVALAPMFALAGPPKWAPGHKNSAAHFAPGQIKKRHAHDRHLSGDWTYVDDYQRWGLEPPSAGHRYVRKNGEILEVVKDTLAIVGAVAVVDALLD
ncbi:RcnB family protein [Tritonibacter sp. SIMBA_163]|uniref:RcnB family protein n=1 Tax=Tritonibacter sp. SIMBA_163 TaxID=3080868 RepID=UPI00397F6626